MQTDNFNFDLIDQISDLLQVYNPTMRQIDVILKIFGSPGDGSGVTVEEPVDPLTHTFNTDGELPATTNFWYGYTFVDPATGLESAISPALAVTTPDELLAPAAPGLVGATSGGNLPYGVYNYVLSWYAGTPDVETSAVNEGTVELFSGGGSDQMITITPESLPADADGYNIYRRRPGNNSFYFLTSVVGDDPFVDDGLTPEDCEQFAPVVSNAISTFGVEVALDDLPVAYEWNIYRTTVNGVWGNTQIGSVTDGSLWFIDTGFEQGYGTPPSETLVIFPPGGDVDGGSF